MSLKVTSLAATAVVALGLGSLGSFGPARAFDTDPTADVDSNANVVVPSGPTCSKGQVLDTKSSKCIADTSVVKCDSGFTFDANKNACIKNTALNDDVLYYQGRLLALAGYYPSAIDALSSVQNKTSNVLTMLGYATRKSGDLEQGISIYYQALALDPNNISTHEYLGEGYLAEGRVDLAEAELDKVQGICGNKTCVQYQALNSAILGDGVWAN